MHIKSEPSILYFGTPVILISTLVKDDTRQRGHLVCIEVRIQRVHIEESILMNGEPNWIDPNKWRPLIMSFQEFYGLSPHLQSSTLGQTQESFYRSPDVDRARSVKE